MLVACTINIEKPQKPYAELKICIEMDINSIQVTDVQEITFNIGVERIVT